MAKSINQVTEESSSIVVSRLTRPDANNNNNLGSDMFKDYCNDPNFRFAVEFTAGALGGAVSRTVTAPIDRLRTIFQVHSVEMSSSEISMIKMYRFMVNEGKIAGMWRGNLVNVIKTAPENAIRLATYERFKALLGPKSDRTFGEKILCGSGAGFVSTIILYPLKTVKTIMNLGKTGEFKSIIDCINKIYTAHGIHAFYRGLVPNLFAIVPATGIDLAIYETLKKQYAEYRQKSEANFVEKIGIGCLSSSIGNLFVYPLIFARTRLQSNRNPNETTLKLLTYVFQRDGLPGIYRGFFLHIAKICPSAGVSYFTFEYVTKSFSINSLS